MIDGINGISSGSAGYPVSFITNVRQSTPKAPTAPVEQVSRDVSPEQIAPPTGDEAEVKQEYMALELAHRQFSQILPKLEMANADVE